MTRRRNVSHLLKEHELYSQGEIIRLVTKRPKVEKEYEVKSQEVWSKLRITLPWLVTQKKILTRRFHRMCGKGQWIADLLERTVVLRTPLWAWCSPCQCAQQVLQKFSYFSLFPLSWSAKLLFTITVIHNFFWNAHAISYTWCSEQPYTGVLLLPKSNLISRAEGSQ